LYGYKVHDRGLGLWPRLYAALSVIEAAYVALVALYKGTLSLPFITGIKIQFAATN